MLKHHWLFISRLERLFDNIIVVLSFLCAYHFRDELVSTLDHMLVLFGYAAPLAENAQALAPIEDYMIVLGVALPVYNAALSALGGYSSMRFSSWFRLLRLSTLASLGTFSAIASTLFLLKLDLSRSFVGTFTFVCAVLLFVERLIVLRLLRYFRARGRNYRNLLIYGTGKQAQEIYYEMLKQPEVGVKVVGFVQPGQLNCSAVPRLVNGDSVKKGSVLLDSAERPLCASDLPVGVVADVATFESALKQYAVDEVLFTDVKDGFGQIQELAEIAVEEGVRVTLAADFFGLAIKRSDVSFLGDKPLIHFHPSPGDSTKLMLKRFIDIVLSAFLLIVLLPLLLFVAIGVKLSGRGPILFVQRRVGLNGRIFQLYKFRSMVANAEALLPSLKSFNEMQGPAFKLKKDPRVTAFGRLLRKYSIDELPQLFNVLRGDMSLVGPRPPLPHEVSYYMRSQRRRLSMRPGLTCTWQVSGRNEIPDFGQWAKLDLDYIDNWSLMTDIKLLLRTIPAVIFGTGAR